MIVPHAELRNLIKFLIRNRFHYPFCFDIVSGCDSLELLTVCIRASPLGYWAMLKRIENR